MQNRQVVRGEKAINLLNELTKNGKKYFFIADFTGEEFLIFDLDFLLQQGENSPVWFNFAGFGNISETSRKKVNIKRILPYPYEKYKKAFNKVQKHIHLGNTYLLNLTFRSQIFFDDGITLEDIYNCSDARFKILLKDRFVSFSPEPFISIDANGIVSTFPMKGTINASIPRAKELLGKNAKEISEHYTIVDLLRNDLALVAEDVEVRRFRYFELISTVRGDLWQTSSEITGMLHSEYRNSYGTILKKMLPAGSVSGAPKKRTVEIITEVEESSRGFYTGVAGFFDGKRFVSAVLIRYIEKEQNNYFYRSGGGIVSSSTCKSEYNELIEKIYLPCK
jgi:para-aminobenzoate synthetase component 1